MKTYTQQEVVQKLIQHYRTINIGSKQDLIMGLTTDQMEAVGNLSLALKEPDRQASKLNARPGRQFPKIVRA